MDFGVDLVPMRVELASVHLCPPPTGLFCFLGDRPGKGSRGPSVCARAGPQGGETVGLGVSFKEEVTCSRCEARSGAPQSAGRSRLMPQPSERSRAESL